MGNNPVLAGAFRNEFRAIYLSRAMPESGCPLQRNLMNAHLKYNNQP